MSKSKPITMLVSYYPKKGKQARLLSLIKKHGPALGRAGLSSKMPPKVWRATDKRTNRSYFVEMFQWKDAYEEVLYGIEGVLTWTVDGTPVEVGPGQALCIPAARCTASIISAARV